MAFDGSGAFSRLYNWVTDKANNVKIRADRMDAEFDGIATALSSCLLRDGRSTITADMSFGGRKITSLGDGSLATDAINLGQADARFIKRDGTSAATADIPLGGFKITGLAAGVAATDAINLGQADAVYSRSDENRRNAIINGDMRVDQRGVGASVTTGTGANKYMLDRWYANASGAALTVQRVALNASGFANAMQINGAASNTALTIGQRIEAANVEHFAGQKATLSVWLSSSSLSTVNWAIGHATATDNFASVTAISSGSFTITSTLTRYSATVDVPAGATTGLQIVFSTGAFTSGNLKVTGVQIERAAIASVFDVRPIGVELALCERYFEKSYDQSIAPGTSSAGGASLGYTQSGQLNSVFVAVRFKTPKRAAAPTISVYNTNGTAGQMVDGAATSVSATTAGIGQSGFYAFNSGGALAVNSSALMHWTAESEL